VTKWIEWAGGICPVDVYEMVEYKLRLDPNVSYTCMAGLCRWDHGRTPESAANESFRRNDIISYRLI